MSTPANGDAKSETRPSGSAIKLSKVEIAKKNSRYLRGTISEVLGSDQPKFDHDDAQILKFHGIYQSYDRDHRKRTGAGAEARHYQMMVRVRIPGGRVSPEQFLAFESISRDLANGTLRITSRQGLQFHCVSKDNLKSTIRRVNQTLLTTRGACGDGFRNVMCCPAPVADETQAEVAELALRIADEMATKTRAYYEIWLDGDKVATSEAEEPFYGKQYLPRKFKIAIAMPDDNCVDIYTHDMGMVPVLEDGEVRGVNILVGGGLGMTHGKADTFARLASPLGYVKAAHIVDMVKTVAAVFRDYGNRGDRRRARLKYLIHERGMDWFRTEFESRFDYELKPLTNLDRMDCDDHLGLHQQQDGKWFYGLNVDNGRVRDNGESRLQSGLRAAIAELKPGIAFTPLQNILLVGMSESEVERLLSILDDHGVVRSQEVSVARRFSMACPALPTCALAISESERVMPQLLDQFELVLNDLGLSGCHISIRMTGCPNSCTRPYTADLGIVGRTAQTYDIYVGGRSAGDRLVELYAEKIPLEQVVDKLRPLLIGWKDQGKEGESFGDFYDRVQRTSEPAQILTGAKLC